MHRGVAVAVIVSVAVAAALAPQAGAVMRMTTDAVVHSGDGEGGEQAALRFSRRADGADAVSVEADLAVQGGAEVRGGVRTDSVNVTGEVTIQHGNGTVAVGDAVHRLLQTVDALERRVQQLQDQLNFKCDEGKQQYTDASGNLQCHHYESCWAMKKADGTVSSGIYVIDPDGSDGPLAPMQVYCEHVTDGGGWTLVLAIKSGEVNTWHMYDYESAGLSPSDLANSGPAWEVSLSKTSVLSKTYTNAIGVVSKGEYLSWIGSGLFKLTVTQPTSFDWFRGIYDTTYSNNFVSTILHSSSDSMPQAAPSWQQTDNTMTGRATCPGTGCHYIPDDVSNGWQWSHRHNTVPAAGAKDDVNHASKVFVR